MESKVTSFSLPACGRDYPLLITGPETSTSNRIIRTHVRSVSNYVCSLVGALAKTSDRSVGHVADFILIFERSALVT